MTREEMINLLISLSTIEGAVCVAPVEVRRKVEKELDWVVELLVEKLKDNK